MRLSFSDLSSTRHCLDQSLRYFLVSWRDRSRTVTDSSEKIKIMNEIMTYSAQWLRFLAKESARGDGWEDLEQELYMALWKSLDRFSGRSSITTWTHSVARNTIKRFNRKNHKSQERDELVYQKPDRVEQDQNEIRILEEFIKTLGEPDKQVFQMYLEDVGYRQISAVTGIEVLNLRKRLSRIKQQFKVSYNGS